MASLRMSWLVAFMGLAGFVASAPAIASGTAIQTTDDIKLPPGVPSKIKMTDKPNDPAGKLIKIRSGPYTIPPNSMFGTLPVESGGVVINKPCDECYVAAFQGGLEYEDGSDANVDTGMYLHHFVIVNNNKPDWVCGLRYNGMMRMPQYVYNSGNERPPVRLNSKYKFGMRFDKEDTLSSAGELMNMSNETKTVYATTIYEVIPLDTPGYREATHLRMDVWQCGGSDVPAKKGAYKYTSVDYDIPYAGVILHNDGHGHDGTTEVSLHINGKQFCNSVQYYGLNPGAIQPKSVSSMHGLHHDMQYISDATVCEDEGRIEIGDQVHTEAHYDDTKYPQMMFRNEIENQMGINFLYIGRDENTLNNKLPLDPRGSILPIELGGVDPYSKTNASSLATSPVKFIDAIPAPRQRPKSMSIAVMLPFLPTSYTKGLSMTSLMANASIQSMLETVAKKLVKGVPQDFKISKILLPGGINLSEIKDLQMKIAAARAQKGGVPNPAPSGPLPGFASDGRLMRQLYGLEPER